MNAVFKVRAADLGGGKFAAELFHTVAGSFGLVTVAPFTALCAGGFLARPGESGRTNDNIPNIAQRSAHIAPAFLCTRASR